MKPSKIGVSLILIALLSGCAAQVEKPPSYDEVIKANESLLIAEPEYIPYTVKGLQTISCEDSVCTLSEDDFVQNQHDKRTLLDLYKASYRIDVARVAAYNSLVRAMSHYEVALARKDAAINHLERALKEERTYNAVKTWAERMLFILGIGVIGTL